VRHSWLFIVSITFSPESPDDHGQITTNPQSKSRQSSKIPTEFNENWVKLPISNGNPLNTYKDLVNLISKLLSLDRLDLIYLVYCIDIVFIGRSLVEHMTMYGYYKDRPEFE
jgi:hypothetical protein